jgi:hypothetical protein
MNYPFFQNKKLAPRKGNALQMQQSVRDAKEDPFKNEDDPEVTGGQCYDFVTVFAEKNIE